MNDYLNIAQAVIAVLLIITILLQQRGGGLGSAFGGGESANPFSTRRGVEKIIFYASIVLAGVFFGLAIGRGGG